MSYNTPIDYLLAKYGERQNELREFLANGNLKDFNEYHKICGVIQGLDFAKRILLDLAKKLETEDE